MTHSNTPSALRTVPLVVVGSLAVTLGLAAPAEAATAVPRADKPKALNPGATANRAVSVSVEAPPASYTIAAGDTVSGIAERFGISTESLLALNGLDWSTLIFPGQVLALGGSAPSVAPQQEAPAVAVADSASASASASHTIVAGDTLWGLSELYGVTIQSIADANGIARDTVLQLGQVLAVPSAVSAPATVAAVTPLPTPEASRGAVTLSEEMRANALLIIATARELGVSDQGIVIALAAAAQESGLINVPYGDRDSLGLFQQRPSSGWGTPEQVSDPAWSIPAFFTGVDGENGPLTRGLLDIDGWESFTVTQAAQAVQISAYPDHYAKWEEAARGWLAELG